MRDKIAAVVLIVAGVLGLAYRRLQLYEADPRHQDGADRDVREGEGDHQGSGLGRRRRDRDRRRVDVAVESNNGHAFNGVLRGQKGQLWEGGHRVPFIVRWPGQVKPGTTSAQLTSLTDVMATVAAIIGADLPKDAAEDSFNLLPALLGKDRGPIRPYLLQQAFGGSRTLSIRRGCWKYLDHPGSGGNRYENNPELKPFILPDTAPGAPGQLYNLEADPDETRNLYFDQPQIAKEQKTLLDQLKASGRSRPERSNRNP